jgi:hypothetical protein
LFFNRSGIDVWHIKGTIVHINKTNGQLSPGFSRFALISRWIAYTSKARDLLMGKKHSLRDTVMLIVLGLGITWAGTAVSGHAQTETYGTTAQTETSGKTASTETRRSGSRSMLGNCSSDPTAKNFDPYCGLNRTK